MQVIIDGVRYVPEQVYDADSSALDIWFDSDAGRNITVRDYLCKLLTTLWDEGEGFSGKRPFGNSGWEWELYKPLVKGGYIGGSLDENGDIIELSYGAEDFVRGLIKQAFYAKRP